MELLHRTPLRARALVGAILAVAVIGAIVSASGRPAHASGSETDLVLTPGINGVPGASGKAEIEISDGVLKGSVSVTGLLAQPEGSGKFYGVWFVNIESGDKAFLGALQHDQSIIFASGGKGSSKFAATRFTTPNKLLAITFGPKNKNLLIVLIENKIDGLNPSPVGEVVSATF